MVPPPSVEQVRQLLREVIDPELGGTAAPGIGFAIPSNLVKDIATQIIRFGHVVHSHRAYLGVEIGDTNGAGVLVLSEFAGAAAQLQCGALLVNPHDIEGMADALKAAIEMNEEERRRRMAEMRKVVREQDIYWWVDYYLQAALGTVPEGFRTPSEYLPALDLDEILEVG